MRTDVQKIARKLDRMTVADLMGKLSGMDPEASVVFESDYGDYTHTRQLTTVGEVVAFDPAEEQLYETAYSDSEVAIRDRDQDEDDDEEPEDKAAREAEEQAQEQFNVVILR